MTSTPVQTPRSRRPKLRAEDWPEVEFLSERLIEARKTKGWTQKEAAKQVGTGQSHLSAIETGQTDVTFLFLARLARAYGREMSYFTFDEYVDRAPSRRRRRLQRTEG